ncbi:MAG: flippase-like domain-containing protein [Nitrospinota bacterium]|nr:flippase-like domain-containing protein [Nitrospinota bacterium]
MHKNTKRYTIWAGWAISLLFVGLAIWKMDLGKVWESMKMVNFVWIIPAVAINFSIICVRSARWRVFIEPVKHISFLSTLSAMAIGFMANMVLPARIGEVVRALVLSEKEKVPMGSAFGTVVIERVFDGLSVVVLMAITLALVTPATADAAEMFDGIKIAGLSASAVFITVFFIIYLFHKQIRPVVWIIDKTTGILPGAWGHKVREMLESIRKGLDSIDHGGRIIRIALWSVPVWALAAPFNLLIFQSMGLELPWSSGFVVLVTQVFGLMVPSGPGFVGAYHAATMAGLMFYGVDKETALSVAVVMHLVVFVAQTTPGFYFLWKDGDTLGGIQEREEKAEEMLEEETAAETKTPESIAP